MVLHRLDITTDPVEYRERSKAAGFRKFSGLMKYAKITLEWGITDSTDLYDWMQQIIDSPADGAGKNIPTIPIDDVGGEQA